MNYTNSHVVSYYPMLPGLFRFEYRLANDVMNIVRVHSWDANIRKHLVDETQQWCAGAYAQTGLRNLPEIKVTTLVPFTN